MKNYTNIAFIEIRLIFILQIILFSLKPIQVFLSLFRDNKMSNKKVKHIAEDLI